jgi:hypothetical protein
MARPRVFVSSTYYDLKHLRSSLENFVESLGFDAILSEKGKIAYTPELPLDESCYREVANSDIFVLIVGGRYGSEASAGKSAPAKSFFDRYNSITRGEYRAAVEREIPMYILIERSVYGEYETYLNNKDNTRVRYAHVDSVNVFVLVEDILSQPRNNPIQQFERYGEIEGWLREQWAGLFRELLNRTKGQAQIASLQSQVAQLSELNTTFKTYLEKIVSRIAPQESEALISKETTRLREALVLQGIGENALAKYLNNYFKVQPQDVRRAAERASSLEEFFNALPAGDGSGELKTDAVRLCQPDFRAMVISDLNEIRQVLGLSPLDGGLPHAFDEPEKIPPAPKAARASAKTDASSRRGRKSG